MLFHTKCLAYTQTLKDAFIIEKICEIINRNRTRSDPDVEIITQGLKKKTSSTGEKITIKISVYLCGFFFFNNVC